MNDTLKEILKTSIYFLVLLLVALFIVTFIGQRTIVDGESMENTLFDKDNLIVDKVTYRFKDPQRFDVIVFPYDKGSRNYFIKRIIGLPGEKVQIKGGRVYIDGILLDDEYGNDLMMDAGIAENEFVLEDEEFFVLGDNRNYSEDSRSGNIGAVKKEYIYGKVWYKKKFGEIKGGFVKR